MLNYVFCLIRFCMFPAFGRDAASAEGQTGAINDHMDTSIRNSSTLKHPTPPVGSLLLPTEEAQSPRKFYIQHAHVKFSCEC